MAIGRVGPLIELKNTDPSCKYEFLLIVLSLRWTSNGVMRADGGPWTMAFESRQWTLSCALERTVPASVPVWWSRLLLAVSRGMLT